jgi:hypothetical protein
MPTPEIETTKGLADYTMFTWAWVLAMSMWGGLVSFVQKVRAGKVRAFNFIEMIGELAVSAFVGVLTFLIAEQANTPELVTAALVGISSHMGTRGLFRLEQFLTKYLGLSPQQEIAAINIIKELEKKDSTSGTDAR